MWEHYVNINPFPVFPLLMAEQFKRVKDVIYILFLIKIYFKIHQQL